MVGFQAPKRKSEPIPGPSPKRMALDNGYWVVQWRNVTTKKHKTWTGDGVAHITGRKVTLYGTEAHPIASGSLTSNPEEGAEYSFNGKDILLETRITKDEYMSGTCFGKGNVLDVPIPSTSASSKQFIPLSISPPVDHKARGLPLQPVDLLSPNVATKKAAHHLTLELDLEKVADSHWSANWRKSGHTNKNRPWDGDGYVSHCGMKVTMVSEQGKLIGSTPWKGDILHSGYKVYIGGREVQLVDKVSLSQVPNLASSSSMALDDHDVNAAEPPKTQKPATFVAPISFYGAPKPPKKTAGPLHDPTAENAIVMRSPTASHMKKYNKKNLPVIPVVLDPILARHLRPHQVEGVKFMYECVMGIRKHEGQGCILADEMGLGKTLQTISLVWTLLKQTPYAGQRPVAEKILIVCPVSLCNNWKAEFHKWLGRDRLGVVVCDKDKNVVKTFITTSVNQVLIVGYERLRTVIKDVALCVPPIGLIVCDEGHRLKSANNKTTAMFDSLRTLRRVILSGTPIQNDLGEFHSMANFCNPGLLDDYSTFRKVYETPILKSRSPDSSEKDRKLGEARSAQLTEVAKSFVLRREANILGNYLPPKHEYTVFVTPTALQLSIFSQLLHPQNLDDLVSKSTAESLAMITLLTKVCNSPILLKKIIEKGVTDGGGETAKMANVLEAVKLLPSDARLQDPSLSGKLIAISRLLKSIRRTTSEKCVVVSHYTSTLDILECYCKHKSYNYYRLDGQTPAAKRQEFVNAFNKSSQHSSFVFLLSSKAGGVGINLIGASRLVLIDSDWNPSHDLQSMARCHRDGQKRPVFIYRFLTAGTIDESIYQRQVTKLGLSDALMGSSTTSSKSDSFSKKDLRDIFRVHPDTACHTHDLLDCPCASAPQCSSDDVDAPGTYEPDDEDLEEPSGFILASSVDMGKMTKADKAYLQRKKEGLAALGQWKHINTLQRAGQDEIYDEVLRELCHNYEANAEELAMSTTDLLTTIDLDNIEKMDESYSVKQVPGGTISFVFEKKSQPTIPDQEHSDD